MQKIYIFIFFLFLLIAAFMIFYKVWQIRKQDRKFESLKDLEDQIVGGSEVFLKATGKYLKIVGMATLTAGVKAYLFSRQKLKKGYSNLKTVIKKKRLSERKPIAFLIRKTKEYKRDLQKIKEDIENKQE